MQHVDMATPCGCSRSDLALAQGAVAGTIPSTKPKFVVYESTPRFLRAFCDSNRSVHYAHYLGGSASEASLRYGGSKTRGSPIPSNSVHRHPPDILKEIDSKRYGTAENRSSKSTPIPTWSESEGGTRGRATEALRTAGVPTSHRRSILGGNTWLLKELG